MMKRKTMVKFGIVWLAISFAVTVAVWWAIAGVLASGLKTATKSCGEVWPVDKIVATDWFCSK